MIDYSLYLVTDQFDLDESEFLNIIEEAILGGTTIVQIREKNSSTRDFLDLAQKAKRITDKYDVPLIINDRIDIALAVDSAGVHLGQSDMPCTVARRLLGDDKIVGISATTYDEAIKAQLDGADYLGIGAVYPTSTKSDVELVTDSDLSMMQKNITIPCVAIGGVKEDNTEKLIKTDKFSGVAVVSAIMLSDNPRKTSENFIKIING